MGVEWRIPTKIIGWEEDEEYVNDAEDQHKENVVDSNDDGEIEKRECCGQYSCYS